MKKPKAKGPTPSKPPSSREPRLDHLAQHLLHSLQADQVALVLKQPSQEAYETVGSAPLRESSQQWPLPAALRQRMMQQPAGFPLLKKERTTWTLPDSHSAAYALPYLSGEGSVAGWVLLSYTTAPKPLPTVLAGMQAALGALAIHDTERLAATSALQMMALFLDAAADGVCIVCAASDTPLYINPAARRILHIPAEVAEAEVLSTRIRTGRYAAEGKRIIRQVKEHGSWTGESTLTTWTGEPVPVSEMMVLFPFAGATSGWALGAIFRDLRPEKQNQSDTLQLAAFLQKLRHTELDAYFIYDLETGQLISGAPQVAKLLGYREEDLYPSQRSLRHLIHPDDIEAIYTGQMRLRKQLKPRTTRYQLRLLNKAGQWETASMVLGMMQRDGSGAPHRLIGRIQLITDIVSSTEALRRSEALYHQIVESIGDSVLMLDAAGHVQFANRTAERSFGVEKGKLIGQHIEFLLKIAAGTQLLQHPSRPSAAMHRVECEVTTQRGQNFIAELRYRHLDAGRTLCILRDLSPQLRLADATQKQNAYYRGLFQNNTSGAVIFDPQLCILAVNPALAAQLKHPQHELIGRKLTDLVAEDSLELAREHFLRMRHDRHFNKLFRHGVRLLLRRKDGHLIHTQAALTAISDGIVLFSQGIAIFTDVTAEEQARSALDRQARFNESLVTHVPAAILVLDPSGQILRMNSALEKLSGYRLREVQGKALWQTETMDAAQLSLFRESFHLLLTGEEPQEMALRLFTKAGGIRMVTTALTAARAASGEVLYVIATLTDITETKRLEAEVIRVAEQEQMRIGNDLHDGIGQTLTGILALTEAAQTTAAEPTQTELERIQLLVKDAIVQVRQLSHGLSPAAVKHRGLGTSLLLLAERLTSSLVRCECKIQAEPIFSDPEAGTHLYRIAQEAVSNALKHAKPKNITILLRRHSAGRGYMEIVDDGLGISPQQRGRREGIGLRVMRYRTSLIGGEFSLTTAAKAGTQIQCRFPCAF